ncbi:MAG: hypothetical protein L6R35_006340 [Caloplaca aegaea]|nr:MAG: hypothetical protein L6R35_006340 [Caloplaca aegaea]
MAPIVPSGDDSHQQLLDSLDLTLMPRPFRNPHWRPSQRRNKNIKQIVAEASRKEASVIATQNNSGTSTPQLQSSEVFEVVRALPQGVAERYLEARGAHVVLK